MEFFERVKRLAKEKGTTIEVLAEKIPGKNRDSYYGWKRKNNLPRADEAVKIASALGVTVEYLVTGNPPAGLSEEALAVARAAEQLSPEGRRVALHQVEALAEDFPCETLPSSATGNK